MDKNVKNILAAVGAIAMVKASPVLAVGVAIGAYATNQEKVNKAVMDGLDKTMNFAEDMLVKAGVPEEELERVKNKVLEREPKNIEDLISDEESLDFDCEPEGVEPESLDEEVTTEEEASVAEEPEPTEADKLENLRALGMEFIAALKDVAADVLK